VLFNFILALSVIYKQVIFQTALFAVLIMKGRL
jgi:hypothetical protein